MFFLVLHETDNAAGIIWIQLRRKSCARKSAAGCELKLK
jgi:hypothetical protein